MNFYSNSGHKYSCSCSGTLLNIEELRSNFGFGKHYLDNVDHAISRFLNERAKALIMFHALTGCDTVSIFHGRGKETAWSAWMAYPAVTDIFLSLLLQPEEISPEVLYKIEWLVVLMYSKSCALSRLNEARK